MSIGAVRGERVRTVGSCVLLLAVCGLGALPATAQVDGATLMRDVRALAHDSMAGRAAGSEGSARARRFVVARARGLGLAVDSQTFSLGAGRRGVNLVVAIPGRVCSVGTIVLSAHYDHEGVRNGVVYNGADDNASGVAALLAIAEELIRRPLEHDVRLLFTDAEELGLRGARAYVDALEDPGDVALAVNLDMVSRSEEELWVVGTAQNPRLRPVLESVEPAGSVTLRFGHDDPERGAGSWVHASDHAPFHEAGVPFVYFGVEDHVDYHRPSDDPERIDAAWYAAAVETIHRSLRALDGALAP